MGNGYCFVCGTRSAIGLKLDFVLDKHKKQSTCETVIPEQYCGWTGFVHGGIIASVFDGAMVHACKSIDLDCMTAQLTIRYKKPVPLNKKLTVLATVQDRRTVLGYAVVYTQAVIWVDGSIAGKAHATMFVKNGLD
jgi:acyl-coenzyme A thioesterase PaaI-like protein